MFNYQGSFYCSFQATAFIFYQKLFSLSRTFLFFLLLVSCSMASLWQLIYVITSELLCQPLFNDSYKLLLISLMNHSIELPLDQGLSVSTPSSISEVALWFSVPFSATKIILSREHSIVNIFYIFYIFQIIHTFSSFRSLKSTTDITNFFDFNSPYGNGFPLSEIPDQDFSFCYISTSNGNCDKISCLLYTSDAADEL